MDGRVVDRAVREIVRPCLKNAGFTMFTGRKAWRFQPATIELVTFRSFTSYVAAGVGCTTFSFAVTAGVWYRCEAALGPDHLHVATIRDNRDAVLWALQEEAPGGDPGPSL